MNFEKLEADVTKILPVHFNSGREGRKIDKVILHHNGADLSIDGCYNVWLNREASAHYQVQSDGKIGQLVNDWDTAWHAGNWDANLTSIGIEHADCSNSPWWISDACLDSGAHLTAAICKYYGLGRPAWDVNVFGHKNFSATECPASIAGAQNAAYMQRAGEWYDAMCGGAQPSPVQPSTSSAPSASGSSSSGVPAIRLQAQTADGTVLPWTQYPDFAGWRNNGAITYLCVDCEWPIDVEAYAGGRWWGKLRNPNNINDKVNGCVGNGQPITGLKMYLNSPNGNKVVKYQVAVNSGYYSPQRDTETSNGQDGYAGDLSNAIYEVKAWIADY